MVTAIESEDQRLEALQQVAELTAASGPREALTVTVLAEAGVVGAAAQVLETGDPLTQDELDVSISCSGLQPGAPSQVGLPQGHLLLTKPLYRL